MDFEMSSSLGDTPAAKSREKSKGRKKAVPKEKGEDFLGYIGEYLVSNNASAPASRLLGK
jgi:hypothetical protein